MTVFTIPPNNVKPLQCTASIEILSSGFTSKIP